MPGSEIGCNGIRKIQKVSLGIKERIGDPVIKILDGFFISPKKFKTFCIAESIVVEGHITPSIIKTRFYEAIVFLIKYFRTENPQC